MLASFNQSALLRTLGGYVGIRFVVSLKTTTKTNLNIYKKII